MDKDFFYNNFIYQLFHRKGGGFSLRMAPMIDLVFLLLIFFLVISKFRPREDFIPLNLPAQEAGMISVGKPEPLVIKISGSEGGCVVWVGDEKQVNIAEESMQADLAGLSGEIEAVLLEQRRNVSDPVEILCEPDIKAQYWVRVCNLLYGLNITDITFPFTQAEAVDQ